jgi:hypothetical protein
MSAEIPHMLRYVNRVLKGKSKVFQREKEKTKSLKLAVDALFFF